MKLSIITINYNNINGLSKTIDSVLCQTWKDFEWIFIDGGSTDGSKELIKKTAAECPNVSYWCSEPDRGVYNAMNKGILRAKGEYLNFMNSGDCFYDENVLASIQIQLSDVDILCGRTLLDIGREIIPPEEVYADFFFAGKTLNHQACFIKTSLQKRYLYDETYKIVADRKFLIQALVFNNTKYLKTDIIVALYDSTGLSSNYPRLFKEFDIMLETLIPHRLFYVINGYTKGNTLEENFYIELRKSAYAKYFYSLVIILLKILSVFKKGNCWVEQYPISINK